MFQDSKRPGRRRAANAERRKAKKEAKKAKNAPFSLCRVCGGNMFDQAAYDEARGLMRGWSFSLNPGGGAFYRMDESGEIAEHLQIGAYCQTCDLVTIKEFLSR